MKVWIVSTDKAQSEINILFPIICYNFMSSFISDTYQLALIYFSSILEEDTREKLLSQGFPCWWRKSHLKHKTTYSIWRAKPWIWKTLEFCGMFDTGLARVTQAFVDHCIFGCFLMRKISSKSRSEWSGSLEVYALKYNKPTQNTGLLSFSSMLHPQHLP